MPQEWGAVSAEAQEGDDGSMLALYRSALALRPDGDFAWEGSPPRTLVFRRGDLLCAVNVDGELLALPEGEVLLASGPLDDGRLPANTAAWIQRG